MLARCREGVVSELMTSVCACGDGLSSASDGRRTGVGRRGERPEGRHHRWRASAPVCLSGEPVRLPQRPGHMNLVDRAQHCARSWRVYCSALASYLPPRSRYSKGYAFASNQKTLNMARSIPPRSSSYDGEDTNAMLPSNQDGAEGPQVREERQPAARNQVNRADVIADLNSC